MMKSIENLRQDFLEYGISFWEDSTYKYYVKNLDFFFDFLRDEYEKDLDDIYCDSITKNKLREYIVYLRLKPKKNGVHIRSNTVRTYMRAVKAFINYGFENGYFINNLAYRLKMPRADDVQIVPLSVDEVNIIDRLFSHYFLDRRNKLIFYLMLDCGLRAMEVCRLKVSDICLDGHYITINNGKGKKSRIVPLSSKLEVLIKDYMRFVGKDGYLLLKKNSVENINSNCIRSMFRTIKFHTGIKRVHPHLLRHTFATSYIMGGGNLESLRLLLGHYDYAVTKQYLHLAAQFNLIHTDIYKLDDIFFKNNY